MSRGPCAVAYCDRPDHTRGLCTKDYASWWRGNPLPPLREGVARDYVAERRELARAQERSMTDDLARFNDGRPRTHKTRIARRKGLWGVGASDVSRCRKAIEYRERPPAGFVPLPERKDAAAQGVVIHEGLSRVYKELYPWQMFRVVIPIPGLDVPSEADRLDPLAGRVDDWKTVGEWIWGKVGDNGARDEDIDQALLYALGARLMGYDITEVRVIYIRRADWTDTEIFTVAYDEDRAQRALNYLHSILDALDAGTPLPRDRSGPTVDKVCEGCFARRHCWDMTAAEAAGRTPEGWLEARDDAGVQWALETYAAERDAIKPHAATKDRMAAMLPGVEEGIYGDMTLSWSRGRTEWVDDPIGRVEQLEEFIRAGGEPADLADLPYPQRERTVSTPRLQVGRVRVAKRKAKADAGD